MYTCRQLLFLDQWSNIYTCPNMTVTSPRHLGKCLNVALCMAYIRPKKKIVMLPSPDQNLKIGSVGRDFFFFFFFFFFFLRTVRELSFSIFFLKFLNGENSGRMQSKRIYTSHASAFLSHWIQILANSSPKSEKPDPVFSHFTVGRERAT